MNTNKGELRMSSILIVLAILLFSVGIIFDSKTKSIEYSDRIPAEAYVIAVRASRTLITDWKSNVTIVSSGSQWRMLDINP